MTTPAQTSDTYAEGLALAAQIIEHDGDRFTLGPCRLEVNSSASGTTFTPYTRRLKGVTARPLGEPTGQVGAILRMMAVTAEQHEGFRRALDLVSKRQARFMAGELDLKPDERAAIISRVQETIGAPDSGDYANPMAAVRAVCLAWDKAIRERDEHLAATAAAAATTRQQEDTILRYAREELPDLPEDISSVEAVRQLAQALAGERGRCIRLVAQRGEAEHRASTLREALRKAREPHFSHLGATPAEAERFIMEISHAFGWDSDGRYVDLQVLLGCVKDALAGMKAAEKALREHTSAEAAHDEHGDWALRTALAQRDIVNALVLREGSKRLRNLVEAITTPAKGPYLATLQTALMTAAADRDAEDPNCITTTGAKRVTDLLTLILSEVMPEASTEQAAK